ncbi:hypothetical protein [Mycobacterium sp.]|uniref:hypothetical protein n=1 Tax=Mycobacterium sp. TaxID=1785 RepID=UPI003BAAF481
MNSVSTQYSMTGQSNAGVLRVSIATEFGPVLFDFFATDAVKKATFGAKEGMLVNISTEIENAMPRTQLGPCINVNIKAAKQGPEEANDIATALHGTIFTNWAQYAAHSIGGYGLWPGNGNAKLRRIRS